MNRIWLPVAVVREASLDWADLLANVSHDIFLSLSLLFTPYHLNFIMSTSSLPSSQPPQRLARNPPFRHEHVGSFLRPKALLEARSDFAAGKIDAAALRKVEDEHIRTHVAKLLENDIPDITDGEFRRQVS